MAKISVAYLISFLLGLLVFSCMGNASNSAFGMSRQSKTWCVVTVSAPPNQLQAYINSQCGNVDCRPIQPGGSCYNPNNLQNHASYVLDAVYRKTGICNSGIGTPAVTDPSFGQCHYP